VEALTTLAAERDVGLLDVAIGWLAAQPTVASVIAGATRPEQVRANAAAAEWIPSGEDLSALDGITAPQP
jgi:aryl-alcohol dehydrogenase-like predicted oxidoreductase